MLFVIKDAVVQVEWRAQASNAVSHVLDLQILHVRKQLWAVPLFLLQINVGCLKICIAVKDEKLDWLLAICWCSKTDTRDNASKLLSAGLVSVYHTPGVGVFVRRFCSQTMEK